MRAPKAISYQLNMGKVRSTIVSALLVAAAASTVWAADTPTPVRPFERSITVEFVDTPMRDALDFFDKVTGYKVVVDPSAKDLVAARSVTIKVTKQPLGRTLSKILAEHSLAFDLKGNEILIVGRANGKADRLNVFIQDLSGPDEERRLAAAAALGDLRHKPAIPALMKMLREENKDFRTAAAKALALMNEPARFMQALSGKDMELRADGALVLGYMKYRSAIPILANLLKDPGPGDLLPNNIDPRYDVLKSAVEALVQLDERAPLRQALTYDGIWVAQFAAEALATLKDRPAIPGLTNMLLKGRSSTDKTAGARALAQCGAKDVLVKALSSEDRFTRRETAYAMEDLKDLTVVPLLAKALKSDPEPEVRRASMKALYGLVGEKVLPLIADALADGSGQVRSYAAHFLGDAKAVQYADRLTALVTDDDARVRESGARALGYMGPAGEKGLLVALRDSSPRVVSMATGGLGRCATEAAVPSLIGFIRNSRDDNDRLAAVRALGHTKSPNAVLLLIELMNDPKLIRAVAESLGEIGDRRAVPALATALKDPDTWIRQKVALALEQIGDPSSVPAFREAIEARPESKALYEGSIQRIEKAAAEGVKRPAGNEP